MSIFTSKFENNTLTLAPHGRIDSSNADSAGKEVDEIRAQYPNGKMVIDAEDLEYLSSAGLRVVLRLRKNEKDLAIINVCSDVYDVFEMTGFTEMLPISKAFRRVSLEGCEAIGQGANGKVYRLNEDTVIKVYNNPDSLPDIQRERDLAKTAFVLGVPTAIPYDVVRVGDSYGSVFELLSSSSFAKRIKANPENVDDYIRMSVELLKKMHETEVDDAILPNMKEVALDWGAFLKDYIPADSHQKLMDLLRAVPDCKNMLHGDYHVKNVMMQGDEPLLIDMDTLCYGHPVYELASMFNAYLGYSEVDYSITESALGLTRDITEYFWKKSLELYLNTTDEKRLTEVENKARIVGYTRMIRRSIRRHGLENPTEKKTIEHFIEELIELLKVTDSLDF